MNSLPPDSRADHELGLSEDPSYALNSHSMESSATHQRQSWQGSRPIAVTEVPEMRVTQDDESLFPPSFAFDHPPVFKSLAKHEAIHDVIDRVRARSNRSVPHCTVVDDASLRPSHQTEMSVDNQAELNTNANRVDGIALQPCDTTTEGTAVINEDVARDDLVIANAVVVNDEVFDAQIVNDQPEAPIHQDQVWWQKKYFGVVAIFLLMVVAGFAIAGTVLVLNGKSQDSGNDVVSSNYSQTFHPTLAPTGKVFSTSSTFSAVTSIGEPDSTTFTSMPPSKPSSSHPTVVKTSERFGPIHTYNHKILLQEISTPGDVADFEQTLTNYINIFFSPFRNDLGNLMSALTENDHILNSLSDVNIDLTIEKLEWPATLQWSLQENPQLIIFYDQSTEYSTTDSSISIGAIVQHPYESQYQPVLIEYLNTTDEAFAKLSSVVFCEGDCNSPSPSETTSHVTSSTSSGEPTMPPSVILMTTAPNVLTPTELPTPFLPALSVVPTPTQLSTESFTEFPELATVKGFMWIDSNGDGLYQTSEPPATGTFANLRTCANDTWVGTTTSDSEGQYQFLGVEEGEYFVEFFLPSNKYQLTVPMMGSDNTALDSDVSLLSGRSPCIAVDASFSHLINAGYVLVDSSDETTATPTE